MSRLLTELVDSIDYKANNTDRSPNSISLERRVAISRKDLRTGDLVKVLHSDWAGSAGIVTRPITEQNIGHVLIFGGGYLLGLKTSIEDVEPADENYGGFAQLAYNLIKLGSHVIEQRLIVYRS